MIWRQPHFVRQVALCCCALVLAQTAYCDEEPHWGFSVVLGGHLPDLKPLSDGLYKSKLVGDADVLLYEGGEGTGAVGEDIDENITETQSFEFDNPLPDVGIASHAGVEFQWHANDRHSFILGAGSMEKTSISQVVANLPMQQYYVSNEVLSERRGKVSYTEYTLGWRYNWLRKDKFKLYSRLSLHEVFDIDFRDDFTFHFLSSPIEDLVGVRRVMVVEAQTAALIMGQLGVGGEWFLYDWLSLGFEGGILFGERDFTLRDVRTRDDFLSGDSINRSGMPYIALSDGTLGYLRHDATSEDVYNPATLESNYLPMRLRFDGARFLFRVTFYF